MNRSGRFLIFILLNIFISACTTLAVLIMWDQLRGPLPGGLLSSLLQPDREQPQSAALTEQPGTTSTATAPAQPCIPYQAVEADTFESLAERYRVSVAQLREQNGFSASQEVKPGDLLCIPVSPQGEVIIKSVVGAGDIETEHVSLENLGQVQLPLAGWRIEDGGGNVFVFPSAAQFILYPGGGVDIYTRSGMNNVSQLYWGLLQPVWTSGATVTLRDAQGGIQATYVIP